MTKNGAIKILKGGELIRVGDEVVCKSDACLIYTVTRIYEESGYKVFDGIGAVGEVTYRQDVKEFRPTGKHFPQIADVLKEMSK